MPDRPPHGISAAFHAGYQSDGGRVSTTRCTKSSISPGISDPNTLPNLAKKLIKLFLTHSNTTTWKGYIEKKLVRSWKLSVEIIYTVSKQQERLDAKEYVLQEQTA